MDRCEKHNKKVLALKEEPGEWSGDTRREGFQVASLDEIEAAQKK